MAASFPWRHDPHLPVWGPYTKDYMGISHIAQPERGIRFDLSIFPGFYRRMLQVPNVAWESGFYPWEASADLTYYKIRFEMTWKDQAYMDLAFAALDEHTRLIRCEMVNNTDQDDLFVLHYMASIHYPALAQHSRAPLRTMCVQAPANVLWQQALDYTHMAYAAGRPTDNLMPDGLLRGEHRGHDCVQGSMLGTPEDNGAAHGPPPFGAQKGDTVSYTWHVEKKLNDAVLAIRYQHHGEGCRFAVSGMHEGAWDIPPAKEMVFARYCLGTVQPGDHTLTLTALASGRGIGMDCLLLGERGAVEQTAFVYDDVSCEPDVAEDEEQSTLILKYSAAPRYYGLHWEAEDYWIRHIQNSELDSFMRLNVHHHTAHVLKGDGMGHYLNVFQRPIAVKGHGKKVLYGLVLDAPTREDAQKALAKWHMPHEAYEALYTAARMKRARFEVPPQGEAYQFSQERMLATCLLNVVYPVYMRRQYIRHFTPGRWWDCLYTWDSGFIGIGLQTVSNALAADCFKAYLTPPGDTHSAFIHHGSMVPTQFYLFLELWNHTQDRELLKSVYPSLRQYYLFLTGRLGSSTIAAFSSGLLKTWDYFYNSGGWDDYPPQMHAHQAGLTPDGVAPAITTTHAVRCAKILLMAARQLGGLQADMDGYAADTARLMAALENHAWDETAGYYSYVLHDANADPAGKLIYASGENFNRGLDGISPLITGMLDARREDVLIAHMTDPKQMWCRIGLSSVDQSAPYFKKDGYWNGAVWMPHQWLLFKALLDANRADVALRIAHTALALWKNEVDRTYNCFEHFIVDTGTGAGWHQFGGLSAPVLSWFRALYVPGEVTPGLDGWVEEIQWADAMLKCTIDFAVSAHSEATLLICLPLDTAYTVYWNSVPISARRCAGCCAISVTIPCERGTLTAYDTGSTP